jgi:hypothetical protein
MPYLLARLLAAVEAPAAATDAMDANWQLQCWQRRDYRALVGGGCGGATQSNLGVFGWTSLSFSCWIDSAPDGGYGWLETVSTGLLSCYQQLFELMLC